MKLLLDRNFNGLPQKMHRFAFRRLVRQIEPYHPISVEGKLVSPGERGCSDRWSVISKVLSEHPGTVLDLGCAEGYFVSRAAREYGCFTLGVDADIRRLTIAQELNVINKNQGAGFMYAHITPEFLNKLPQFDVVIFLAVLHHAMYEHSIDYARELLKCIHAKTGKSLIFEMGQSNEIERDWAPLLPDMGTDPHEWIRNFLLTCGFSEVIKAAETDTYKGGTRRGLFIVHP